MTDDDLAERLAAVERRLDAAYPEPEDRVEEERVEAMAERLADLEGTVEALEGYVGEIERVDDELERRADAALAATDDLDARVAELEERLSTPDDAVDASAPEAETHAQPAAAAPRQFGSQSHESDQQHQRDDSSRAGAVGASTAESASNVVDDRSDDVDARHRPASVPADREPAGREPADRRPADRRPTDCRPTDRQPTERQPPERQPTDRQPATEQQPSAVNSPVATPPSPSAESAGEERRTPQASGRTTSVSGWGSDASDARSTSADAAAGRNGPAAHHDDEPASDQREAPASGQPAGWRATGSDDEDLDDWSSESDAAPGDDEPGETLFERLRELL